MLAGGHSPRSGAASPPSRPKIEPLRGPLQICLKTSHSLPVAGQAKENSKFHEKVQESAMGKKERELYLVSPANEFGYT